MKLVGALAVGVERGHHDILQPDFGAMQASLHCLFGNTQSIGGFGTGHLLDGPQHEDGPEIIGQPVDRFL